MNKLSVKLRQVNFHSTFWYSTLIVKTLVIIGKGVTVLMLCAYLLALPFLMMGTMTLSNPEDGQRAWIAMAIFGCSVIFGIYATIMSTSLWNTKWWIFGIVVAAIPFAWTGYVHLVR